MTNRIKHDFIIRELTRNDFHDLDHKFGATSVYKRSLELWEKYLHQQQTKERLVKVVEVANHAIGIGTLKIVSDYSQFKIENIPEINDVVIDAEYHGLGIGYALIQSFEQGAKELGYKKIGLAVGLYKDYGKAQRLYAKMGYIPDGAGITYHNQPVVPGDSYPVDDDLLLWLTKAL